MTGTTSFESSFQASADAAQGFSDDSDDVSKPMRGISVVHIESDDEEDVIFLKVDKGKKRDHQIDIASSTGSPSKKPKSSAFRAGSTSTFCSASTSDDINKDIPPKHHYFQTRLARPRLVWLSPTSALPADEQMIWTFQEREVRCTKIFRAGCSSNASEYKTDDAIQLGHSARSTVLIRYLFSIKPDDTSIAPAHYAHVHHMTYKSPTLQGVSRRGEMYLKHLACQDVRLEALFQGKKLDFEVIGGRNGATRGDTEVFCQFVDRPSHIAVEEPNPAFDFHGCDSCFHRHEKRNNGQPRLSRNVLSLGGRKYHLHDFVFIDSQIQGVPHIIGHVQRWVQGGKCPEVQIRRLERYGAVVGSDSIAHISERRLVITNVIEIYPASRIDKHAIVLPNEADLSLYKHDVAFWCSERLFKSDNKTIIIPLQRPLPGCLTCLRKAETFAKDLIDCLKVFNAPAADYYSGAGGFLLAGLEIFDWISAVDIDEVACATMQQLKMSMSRLRVHHASVTDLLYRTTQPKLVSIKRHVLPPPGSVFLATAGPPCQGHSRANFKNTAVHGKVPADPRNDDLFVFLAEIDRLRPWVVLIENVGAFKDDKQDTSAESADENFARRTMKELTAMGYSVRLGLLDSRAYGSPQNRERCFILAVKAGLPLPAFPSPTHATPSLTATIFRDEHGAATPFYMGERRGTRGTAPLLAVTIEDAISDLPGFDYTPPPTVSFNPRKRIRPTCDSRRDPVKGNATKIGFDHAVPYASAPRSDYQQSKRKGAGALVDQFTSYVTTGQNDIIFNTSSVSTKGCERRASWKEGFWTLLTSSAPGGKGTAVIHPTQDRKFTIAERKRAMGWPDWYRLAGTPLEQDRLTGNGVCFESVQAIYMSIIKEVVLPWWVRAGKPREGVWDKFKAQYP